MIEYTLRGKKSISKLNVILNKEKLIDVLEKNSKCDNCIAQELCLALNKEMSCGEFLLTYIMFYGEEDTNEY